MQSVIDTFSQARISQEDGILILRYSYGSIAFWLIGLIVLLVISMLLWSKWKRRDYAVGVFAVAVVVGVLIVPGVFASRILIGEDYVSVTKGLWFDQFEVRLPLSNTSRIVVSTRRQEGRDARDVAVWTFQEQGRDPIHFEPAELWTANESLIADELQKRGVHIEGLKK